MSSITIPTKKDIFAFFFFLCFWLLPLGYYGITQHPLPYMPRFLSELHNSSALFTRSVNYWPQYFVQFQFSPQGEWFTYNPDRHFKLLPFGYRSRLNRAFEIFGGKNGNIGRWELAAWLYKRYQKENPGEPSPYAIRFLLAKNPVGNISFAGHWKNKPLSDFSSDQLSIISVHEFIK